MTDSTADTRNSHIRYWIIAVLFIISSINYASRATLGVAGRPLADEYHLDSVQLGYLLSAFAIAYAIGQIPGGALLDRYGSRPVYIWSITLWAVFTGLQAFVTAFPFLPASLGPFTLSLFNFGITIAPFAQAILWLFLLRLSLGFAESPSFPANARIVANWFPKAERGTASAIFNASQYFSVVAFTPLMGWLAQEYGWRSVFSAMGAIGLAGAAVFAGVVQSPSRHKHISQREFAYIEEGGALVKMDSAGAAQPIRWSVLKQLLSNRMLWGMYIAQYCITALTFFYSTWFFIYLRDARHMSLAGAGFAAAVPAIAGFVGGVLGGIFSDYLLKRNMSLSSARKIPILVGLVISCAILACNYTDSQMMILIFMSLAFFGKGVAALGWAVMSDAAPKEATGLAGSVFNLCGNLSGIFTPIVIGYILKATSNDWTLALVFLFAHSIVAMIGYGVIAGEIKRVVLKPV